MWAWIDSVVQSITQGAELAWAIPSLSLQIYFVVFNQSQKLWATVKCETYPI